MAKHFITTPLVRIKKTAPTRQLFHSPTANQKLNLTCWLRPSELTSIHKLVIYPARFNRIAPEFYYAWYPKSRIINNHGPGTDIDFVGNDLFGITDADYNFWYKINFQNT